MTNDANHRAPVAVLPASVESCVSAIIPARNEEAVIAACVASLSSQPEIGETLVVSDQSTDGTDSIIQDLMQKLPNLRLLRANGLPDGWVGKNYALSIGVQQAKGAWLLFTDADAVHEPNSAARALQMAQENDAVLISFSPEQITEAWYEKALIPFIYLRLAKQFSYEKVNDPHSRAAAANGQFLMIRRDIYDALGGHAGVAGEVLEDVAFAIRAKTAGHRIWFGSGKGIVRVRMYRSFDGMWQGWKKFPFLLFIGILLFIVRQTAYGLDLSRNLFPFSFIFYYVPAVLLYVGVLWASYRSHATGRIAWKGRVYSIKTPGSSR